MPMARKQTPVPNLIFIIALAVIVIGLIALLFK
jgi:hypothetical protein